MGERSFWIGLLALAVTALLLVSLSSCEDGDDYYHVPGPTKTVKVKPGDTVKVRPAPARPKTK